MPHTWAILKVQIDEDSGLPPGLKCNTPIHVNTEVIIMV
jgi:hypothetical protein